MANYTKKAILATFESMLNDMPFEKITVSAIVAKCEISSNTFYYHYRDIYGLLEAWLEGKKNALLENQHSDDLWEAEALKKLLHMMQDNQSLVYHVFNSVSRERLERYIFDQVETLFRQLVHERAKAYCVPEKTERDIASLYCYSILGFVIKFIWIHMNVDVEASVDRMMDSFTGSFDYLIHKAAQTDGHPLG